MDYRIKDLPEEERPREKLEEKGASYLNSVELVSIILRAGIPGKNVKELSAEILNKYPLDSLADRSVEELETIEGISSVKAGQLIAVGELARRMQKTEREKLESFSDVSSMVQDMKFMEREEVRVFFLSSGNEILGRTSFRGEVSSAGFSMQKVFGKALQKNASAVILCHNHPSGDSKPTETDIQTTESMIETGRNLGVKLLDHIIIGENSTSMRAETELSF